jgi:type VI secretion system secreted protein Hcp
MTDFYVQIDGIKGESTDSEHKDWIEVLAFNQSLSQPEVAAANPGGGRATGRVEHQDITITKHLDAASPKLYEACASGKHIKEVTIDMMRAGGDKPVKYMVVKMEDVVISHVATSGSGDSPTESISLNFRKIEWTYTQQRRADGSQGGNTTGGWNLVENKVAA